jgi:hypothetical protein
MVRAVACVQLAVDRDQTPRLRTARGEPGGVALVGGGDRGGRLPQPFVQPSLLFGVPLRSRVEFAAPPPLVPAELGAVLVDDLRGVAAHEQLSDAGDHVVGVGRQLGVFPEVAAGDVEAGLLAVASSRCGPTRGRAPR